MEHLYQCLGRENAAEEGARASMGMDAADGRNRKASFVPPVRP